MTAIAQTRRQSVDALLSETRAALAGRPLDRSVIADIKESLIRLAGQRAYWDDPAYPDPEGDERQSRFLIAQDSPDGLSLYLNVMRPGKKIPPHNHTTWACIAAVIGDEQNYLYDRLDDGAAPGKAEIRRTAHVEVKPGTGIALMPDDIHHVEISGSAPIRHLHFYGRPLENLTERLTFDPEAGTCKIMQMSVKTR